jgi:hypothetical protein
MYLMACQLSAVHGNLLNPHHRTEAEVTRGETEALQSGLVTSWGVTSGRRILEAQIVTFTDNHTSH